MDLSHRSELEFRPYKAPWLLRNGHLATILPKFFRPDPPMTYLRERISTPDGDFLDLDHSGGNNNRKWTALVVHGLEGNSSSGYIKGMCHHLNESGYDAVALNLRSCSGESNRLYRSYHSGATEDLQTALLHLRMELGLEHLILVGFSLGGNLTLKYMGEQGENALPATAVAISVPCDLSAGAKHLAKGFNQIYLRRFLKTLKRKAIEKKQQFPEAPYTIEAVQSASNFEEFDDLYTGPAHGFRDAEDYYQKCSSKYFIAKIQKPSLILNAADDPFLPPEAYPHEEVKANPEVRLEIPNLGGHVGFSDSTRMKGPFYSEKRTVAFVREILGE